MIENEIDARYRKYAYARDHRDMYVLGPDGEYAYKENGLTQILDPNNTSSLAVNLRIRDDVAGGPEARAAAAEKTIPFQRGLAKLLAGAYSVPLGGLELLGAIDEGSVNEFGKSFEAMLEKKLPEQEGLLPGVVEGLTQFMIPGIGYYKLFSKLTNLRGFDKFLKAAFKGEKSQKIAKIGTKLFGAEFFTVMTAQNPTDPNFAGFLVDVFGIDRETSTLLENEMIEAIASPAEDWSAINVFKEKFQAVPGDAGLAIGMELVVPFAKSIVKTFRNIKRNGDGIERIVDEQSSIPKSTIDSVSARISEDDLTTETPERSITNPEPITTGGLFDLIRDNPDGFSITLNGQTPQELGYDTGYMVAYSKKMEIVSSEKTFTVADTDKLIDNAELLEDLLGGSEGEIYVGGWLYKGSYYLDASVRVDNLDEALYIANSAKQLGIFDLKEFKNVETKQGIEELKQSGVYDSSKESFQRRKTQTIDRQIDESRLAFSGGNS